jgi:hypothetical protein
MPPGSAYELFDLGRFALVLVTRVGVAAVNALLTEPRALPDQIVDRPLQCGDAFAELAEVCVGRWHRVEVGRKT